MDLTQLSMDDLSSLEKDIVKERARREVQLKKDAREALENTAKEYGFSLNELLSSKSAGKSGAPAGVAKFANPENPAETWTGKGRQPAWFKAAIDAGKSKDDLAL